MKVSTARIDDIEISGSEDVSEYQNATVEVGPKLFQMFTDYKDQVGSVVRELSSNAYDSHVEAGKGEVPFEIHLPDIMEPYFSVRDEGVGLDEEGVRKTFQTFCKSTKNHRADLLGGYGIGGKCFYSYGSKGGDITTIKDGKQYLYKAFIGREGVPATSRFAIIDTDEPNGVEIKIPVDKHHFNDFRKAVEQQLRFFPVKPKILNGNVEFDTTLDKGAPELLVDSDTVRIKRPPDGYSERFPVYVVLGVVGYPLEKDLLGVIPKEVSTLLDRASNGVALIVGIEDVDISTTRENLNYTDRTKKFLIGRLLDAAAQLSAALTQRIVTVDNMWQRCLLANGMGKLTDFLLGDKINFPSTMVHEGLFAFDVSKVQVAPLHGTIKDWKLRSYHYSTRTEKLTGEGTDIRHVIVRERNVFFVRDTNSKPLARLKEFCVQHPDAVPYVLERISVENTFTDEDIEAFSDGIGGAPVQRLSALPDPPKKVYDGTSRSYSRAAKGYQAQNDYIQSLDPNRRPRDYQVRRIFEDLNDLAAGIYVEAEGGKLIPKLSRRYYTIKSANCDIYTTLGHVRDLYRVMGRSFPTLYILNVKSAAYVKANLPDWTPATEFIDEALSEVDSIRRSCAKMQMVVEASRIIAGETIIDEDIFEEITKPKYIRKLPRNNLTFPLQLYRATQRPMKNNEVYQFVCEKFLTTDSALLEKDREELKAGVKKMNLAFPLLRMSARHRMDPEDYETDKDGLTQILADHAIAYIASVSELIVDNA